MTSFYAKTRASWRRWLTRNHAKADAVHLVFYRKASSTPCVSYDDAVEEALCFGWIDGVRHKLDDERYTNRFTPRKAKSNWSAINKARVERLERDGLLHPAGRAAIERAKQDGSWDAAAARALGDEIPTELSAALRRSKAARVAYEALPPSHRKQWNAWVAEAKRAETRERRAAKTVEALANGERRPNA